MNSTGSSSKKLIKQFKIKRFHLFICFSLTFLIIFSIAILPSRVNIKAGTDYAGSKILDLIMLESQTVVQPVKPKISRQKILLVSYFRSGTSWLGELLHETPNSFYVFEPLHPTKINDDDEELEFFSSSKEYKIHELFHCGISSGFMKHLMRWGVLYRDPNCNMSKSLCRTYQSITEHCKSSRFIIIKSVRLYLYEAESLLIKPSLHDLRIIFLVRDVRAVMNSLNKMKPVMKNKKKENCIKTRMDIMSYQRLTEHFPNQIMFLRYEDIAQNPFGKALDIWRFINNDIKLSTLPVQWENFLNLSTRKIKDPMIGSFKVKQKSTQNWQAWRSVIPEKLFLEAERNCDDVLTWLGYRLLGDLKSVRNLSIPVLLHPDCNTIPCNG